MARGRGVGWEPIGAAAQAAGHRLVLEQGIGDGGGGFSIDTQTCATACLLQPHEWHWFLPVGRLV